MKKKPEVNSAQLELSKIYSKWADQDPTISDTLKKESRDAFERAGFRVITGGKHVEHRAYQPEEFLAEMHAHMGECNYCMGVVKMRRGLDGDLMPKHCYCVQCGQRYFMDIEDIKAWEEEQWLQKAEKYS